jgi:hypothetical protein
MGEFWSFHDCLSRAEGHGIANADAVKHDRMLSRRGLARICTRHPSLLNELRVHKLGLTDLLKSRRRRRLALVLMIVCYGILGLGVRI